MRPIVPPEALGADLADARVIDARRSHADYQALHVRGAVHADLESDLSTPGDAARGGRHPLPWLAEWSATLGGWGITPDSRVFVYDDTGGAIAAARVWWMLRAVGHEHVSVVDGGWSAIREAGVPVDDEPVQPDRAAAYPVTEWLRPTVSLEEVDRLRADPAHRLIDVRAPERWRGETEPLDPVAGHIPGSVNLPLTENLGEDGRFLDPEVLRSKYEAVLAGVPPERAVLHCGSGVTACHALLAMEHAGLGSAALYVGSWSEWCRRKDV